MFHASLLIPYVETDSHRPNYSRPPPNLISGEAEYEVEQIRSHRCHGCRKQLQYLLKWKGYPESDNTWEPADQVHASELVKAYHRHHQLEQIKASTTDQTSLTHSSLTWSCSSTASFDPRPTPHTSSQTLSPRPAPISLTSMPSSTASSAANDIAQLTTNTERWSHSGVPILPPASICPSPQTTSTYDPCWTVPPISQMNPYLSLPLSPSSSSTNWS